MAVWWRCWLWAAASQLHYRSLPPAAAQRWWWPEVQMGRAGGELWGGNELCAFPQV
eukprot:COSAG01_NODE_12951_length_1658_cov_1.750481_2_plen_56_part_00